MKERERVRQRYREIERVCVILNINLHTFLKCDNRWVGRRKERHKLEYRDGAKEEAEAEVEEHVLGEWKGMRYSNGAFIQAIRHEEEQEVLYLQSLYSLLCIQDSLSVDFRHTLLTHFPNSSSSHFLFTHLLTYLLTLLTHTSHSTTRALMQ